MHETIRVGSMTITFLKTRHETDNSFDVFEVTMPSLASIVVPHIHRDYDETIIGLNGTTTWTLYGKPFQISAGQQLMIPRGTPHAFANLHPDTARYLCIQTPGVMGPEYYREIAAHYNADATPDLTAISAVMNRYGVTQVTHRNQLTIIKA